MYSRPADPMPQGRPRLAPFLVVQTGPFAPSVTNGIRSLHSAGALVTKRSGGSQQRSMWQSAEIISYRIGEPPPPDERLGPAQSYPILSGSARLMRPWRSPPRPRALPRAVLRSRHPRGHNASGGHSGGGTRMAERKPPDKSWESWVEDHCVLRRHGQRAEGGAGRTPDLERRQHEQRHVDRRRREPLEVRVLDDVDAAVGEEHHVHAEELLAVSRRALLEGNRVVAGEA